MKKMITNKNALLKKRIIFVIESATRTHKIKKFIKCCCGKFIVILCTQKNKYHIKERNIVILNNR